MVIINCKKSETRVGTSEYFSISLVNELKAGNVTAHQGSVYLIVACDLASVPVTDVGAMCPCQANGSTFDPCDSLEIIELHITLSSFSHLTSYTVATLIFYLPLMLLEVKPLPTCLLPCLLPLPCILIHFWWIEGRYASVGNRSYASQRLSKVFS